MKIESCFFLVFVSYCVSAPSSFVFPNQIALNFMKKFGYLDDDTGDAAAIYTEDGITDVIKTMQKFGAIAQTGILDNATIKLMATPRCGVPDIIKNNKRTKRFIIGPEGWNKRQISYYIANWSPKLNEDTVNMNIYKALKAWGNYGNLQFYRKYSSDADIIVTFARGYHGDNVAFDGPGNVLAHAFFPNDGSDLGGDIHFDDDENWIDLDKDSTQEGTDFFTVALHELGHSLGISHSPDPRAVMYPYYTGEAYTRLQLGHDDILAMYHLYILRSIKDEDLQITEEYPRTTEISSYPRHTTASEPEPTTPTYSSTTSIITYEGDDESIDHHKTHDPFHGIPPTNSPSLPDICQGYFDAVATLRNELFVFKDKYLWRLREKGQVVQGYPATIFQMFPDLPRSTSKIDAAYERMDGNIVLFSGNKYWVSDGSQFIENSPRPLTDYGLPKEINEIDAVQRWKRNGKLYFYKNNRFWRYNENLKKMDHGYPKHMGIWRGVPENLNAAITWIDGFTYFFKEELFWKFDNDWVSVTDDLPQSSAQIWIGCPGN